MTSSIIARITNIAMLAAWLTSQTVSGADRLDDWSSPRPIKYRAASAIDSTPAGNNHDANHDGPSEAQADRPSPTQPTEPALAVRSPSNAVARAESASNRALFPVPELMRPEHRGTPTQTIAYQTPMPSGMPAASNHVDSRQDVSRVTIPVPAIEANAIKAQANATDDPVATADPIHHLANARRSESVLSRTQHARSPRFDSPSTLPLPNVTTRTVSGWQLGRLASQKILSAEEMLRRRSPMAARQQAIEALHLIAQSTNEVTRDNSGTEALDQAMAAVREAADFLGRYGVVDSAGLQRLVDSHSTRVLKRCQLDDVNPLRAADTYYEFARGRFVDAVGGWSAASRALVIIAKTEPICADAGDSNLSAAQVCCLRSAIACDPENAVAANELGHELLALGMFDEARWALEHSYAKQPSTAALQNLAELHRLTGNIQLAQTCAANLAALQNQQPHIAQVVQLTPNQFAQVSPQVMTPSSVGGASQAFAGQARVLDPATENGQTRQTNQAPAQPPGRVAAAFGRVKGIFR